MRCPFGVGVYSSDDSYTKYTLECGFDGMDTNTDIKTFYDALTSLDNSLIVGATKNSLAWFTKKKLSKEVASEIYQPNVRYSTDRETGEINTRYAPRFKVKIPVYNNKISTKIWKDLSWSLNDWTEGGQLEMLGTNDLQLECGYRDIDVDLSQDEDELREEMINGLIEWSQNTSDEDKETQRTSLTGGDNARMYTSKKASRPVHLTELRPEDLKTSLKRFSVSLVTKLRSVWFTGGKFGCSWEALHMKVHTIRDTTPVLSASDIDMDNITFDDVSVNKYGGKSVSLKYNSNQIRMVTPKMPMPFGVGVYTPEDGGSTKYSVQVSFREKDDTEEVSALHDFFSSLDDKLVEGACENSLAWFGKKKMTPEVVEAILKPSLQYSMDRDTGERLTQYAPRISVKIPVYGDDIGCRFYDSDGEKITVDGSQLRELLTKGTLVEMKIRCRSLWLRAGQFGLTWEVYEMTVHSTEDELESFVFGDDGDVAAEIIEDTDEEEEVVVVEEEEEEEEDDDDDDDLEVKEPTPPPTPVKKRRGRKKKST